MATRLDKFIVDWLTTQFDGRTKDYRKIDLPDTLAGLDENRAVCCEIYREHGADCAKNAWVSGRLAVVLLLLRNLMPPEQFAELDREMRYDCREFVRRINRGEA